MVTIQQLINGYKNPVSSRKVTIEELIQRDHQKKVTHGKITIEDLIKKEGHVLGGIMPKVPSR